MAFLGFFCKHDWQWVDTVRREMPVQEKTSASGDPEKWHHWRVTTTNRCSKCRSHQFRYTAEYHEEYSNRRQKEHIPA